MLKCAYLAIFFTQSLLGQGGGYDRVSDDPGIIGPGMPLTQLKGEQGREGHGLASPYSSCIRVGFLQWFHLISLRLPPYLVLKPVHQISSHLFCHVE